MISRIDISHKTIIFITVFLLLLWILFQIRDIILLLFVAFIFMSALAPSVEKLKSIGIPKPLAIATIFLLVIGSLIGIITVGFTPFINQTSSFSQRLNETFEKLFQVSFIDQSIIQQEISSFSRQAINFTLNLFENFISFVTVIVITFYLLLDKEKIESRATALFVNQQEKVKTLLRVIEDKLGAWLRGQVVLSLVVAVLTYIGLVALGVEFALPLAIIAGLLEVVPVIGPIIAAIPAILIALTVSPFFAVLVGGLYFAIQQLENHLIVPQVMNRAVGLNPLLVILAISVGGRLLGIGGALLAVPIAVVIQVILQEVLKPSDFNRV